MGNYVLLRFSKYVLLRPPVLAKAAPKVVSVLKTNRWGRG